MKTIDLKLSEENYDDLIFALLIAEREFFMKENDVLHKAMKQLRLYVEQYQK